MAEPPFGTGSGGGFVFKDERIWNSRAGALPRRLFFGGRWLAVNRSLRKQDRVVSSSTHPSLLTDPPRPTGTRSSEDRTRNRGRPRRRDLAPGLVDRSVGAAHFSSFAQ